MAAYRLFFDGFLKDDVPEDILNVIDRSLALIRTQLSAEAWQRLEDRRRVVSTWTDELPKRCRGK